jgi:3-methyladenine DNA glycosylase AlkC
MAQEKFSLKDHLFNKQKVQKIAKEIQKTYTQFRQEEFVAQVTQLFPGLELKQRIVHIRETLREFLPKDYRKAVEVLVKSLPRELDNNRTDGDFGDFIYAPYGDFVAAYGKEPEDIDFSLSALHEITRRFSCEDAIRYFINIDSKKILKVLEKWTKDRNYHVRRLCSEGTRPKLPWSQKISLRADETLPILENLYSDRTRYVTRSVANHLNDISKINPELVLEALRRWHVSKKQTETEMNYITRHALRTLVKNGNREALKLLGYSTALAVSVSNLQHTKVVQIGDALEFSFDVSTECEGNLVVDYTLWFQDKKGNQNSKKVYKLKTTHIKKGEVIHLEKRHPMRGEMTTRTLYPGKHTVVIQVNGKNYTQFDFSLS